MIQSSSGGGSYRTAFTNGVQQGMADLPVAKGGEGQGFGPHELLEAALATCITMTVQMVANRESLPLMDAACEVRIDRSQPDRVTLNYRLSLVGPLTEDQIRRLHDAASRCPVSKTLTGEVLILADTL